MIAINLTPKLWQIEAFKASLTPSQRSIFTIQISLFLLRMYHFRPKTRIKIENSWGKTSLLHECRCCAQQHPRSELFLLFHFSFDKNLWFITCSGCLASSLSFCRDASPVNLSTGREQANTNVGSANKFNFIKSSSSWNFFRVFVSV